MSEWEAVRLGDAISIKHGYAFKGDYFSDTGPGPQLVTPGNFAIGGGFQEGKSKYYLGPVPEGFGLTPGDLIITMTDLSKGGDTLGYPALVPDGPRYLHNQRIGLVRIENPTLLDLSFLYYALRTPTYRAHVLSGATGSTVRHTSPTRISDYTLKAPGIVEQRAVAAILGALDDKIAVNERIVKAAHRLSELCFEAAVRGANLVPLSSLVTPILGGTPDRAMPAYWGSDIPWASAKDVVSSSFGTLVDTEEAITVKASRETKARPVPSGSVILTARGTVGSVARVAQPTALNQSCYAFVPGSLPPGVLYLTVRRAASSMLSVAHGTVFSTVNMKTFDHVITPRLDDRKTREVEDRVNCLLDSITDRIRENRVLAQLRDALLPRLMSGEIRVRDAEKAVEEAT